MLKFHFGVMFRTIYSSFAGVKDSFFLTKKTMEIKKMTKEQQAEINEEFAFYKQFGIEINRFEEAPRPLLTIKESLVNYGIKTEEVDTVYLMSYDVDKTLDYISSYHNTKEDNYKVFIFGYRENEEEFPNERIKIFPTDVRYTEHFNLIELKEPVSISAKSVDDGHSIKEMTKHLLFIEPYHNGQDFGPAYETKLSADASEYEKQSIELLKAKFFIPNEKTVADLLEKYR